MQRRLLARQQPFKRAYATDSKGRGAASARHEQDGSKQSKAGYRGSGPNITCGLFCSRIGGAEMGDWLAIGISGRVAEGIGGRTDENTQSPEGDAQKDLILHGAKSIAEFLEYLRYA